MRTIKGRIDDLLIDGITNMDSFTVEDALNVVNELKERFGINAEYSGITNEIKVVTK